MAAFIIGGIVFVVWVYQWRVQKGVEAMGAIEMPNLASGFDTVKNESAPYSAKETKVELTTSGVWRLHRGKAVDTLNLTETGGVITGSIADDPAWGGKTYSLHGMRVGDEIELFYSTETTYSGSDELELKTTADFSLNGKIEGDKMTGKCKLAVTSFFRSGEVIPHSSEILWTAEKQ